MSSVVMPLKPKILIFIVSYNAASFIESVLNRIPEHVWRNGEYDVEVLVIDDQSSDNTLYRVADFIKCRPQRKIKVLFNPLNQGYGGNQKLGYQYALDRKFDVVVLLHGDGQYAPEYLDRMIRPIVRGEADVVLGSRMINRFEALRGNMPVYKWIGNQILTFVQNIILGTRLSEFHTGYRAYSTKALEEIPFEFNSNYFDFDTDILIQMIDTQKCIQEITVPTYYGGEISHVNGWYYAALILLTTLRSRIVKLNLLYDHRFDYDRGNQRYSLKLGYPSSHQFALEQVKGELTILDIGSGSAGMAKELYERGAKVVSLDRYISGLTKKYSVLAVQTEIEAYDFSSINYEFDLILMLDIIEHLLDPERFMLKLRRCFVKNESPVVIITTGNVAFVIPRIGLLLGQFNYGKNGILDLDHKRLFTFRSMKRLLDSTGYEILTTCGIPAPYPLAIGDNLLSRMLLAVNRILIHFSRGLFSYQMAFVVRPRPTINHLLKRAHITVLHMLDERDADEIRFLD
jgi:glycosyltransferase involved in cell wall biosynthesis